MENKINQNNLNLPNEFLENMKDLLGDNYEKYNKAMQNNSVRGIRINPIKAVDIDFDNIFPYETQKVPYEENGRVLKTLEKIGNTNFHTTGIIYAQEPSSMLPVSSFGFEKNMKVLDLCAAPGGKSTQVASKIQEGLLVSNEIVTARAKILFSNIERLGVINSVILNDTPQNISEKLAGFFDAVIVDAPCSGEGMFRKDPATINEWSEDRLAQNAERQLEILNCADKCLKTGGVIIYSTCTFSEIEDEDVVINYINSHDYEILDVKEQCKSWTTCGTKIDKARRFYPFTGNGEGQFVCVMRKLETANEFYKSKKLVPIFLKGKDKELALAFLKQTFDLDFEYELVLVRDEIMLVTKDMLELLPLKINIINAGVRIGKIEKGVLKPHHQVFSALGKFAKNKIELSDEDYKKYIHGEELDNENNYNGYGVVLSLGATLGGVKCTGNKLKNLYPKGLRI